MWSERGDPVLLFPHPDAPGRWNAGWKTRAPSPWVVPDGTWRQAQRVRRRIGGLASIPCAYSLRDAPSAYHLRHTPHPRRLATMEAIAEALGVLEGPEVREALLRVFEVMVERSLRVRAKAGGKAATPKPQLGC